MHEHRDAKHVGGKSLPHQHGRENEFLQGRIPQAGSFDRASELLKLMSDGRRLEIFWILCHAEVCVVNLAALLEISSPAVSHHLKLLKTAGLVHSRREGKEVYYTSPKTPVTVVLHDMIEQIVEVSCPSEEAFEERTSYDSTTQIIHQVHALLTADCKVHYTIEDLASRFHINQTTLKTSFKALYGQPIASYMKSFRVKKAQELLRLGSLSVAEVAREVGYENPSKFTQAFQRVTGVLPKEVKGKL